MLMWEIELVLVGEFVLKKYLDIRQFDISSSNFYQNIIEVFDVLKKYPFSCRKIFLKNLESLQFEKITMEEMVNFDENVASYYDISKNIIYYTEDTLEFLNHELFHVASTSGIHSGIVVGRVHMGENLNEGITEWLALKSRHQDVSHSGYQLELFVIECLVSIYGESILIPYFLHHTYEFYSQFGLMAKKIIRLDFLLGRLENEMKIMDIFTRYLVIRDIDESFFEDKDTNLFQMNFGYENGQILEKEMKKNYKKISFLNKDNDSGLEFVELNVYDYDLKREEHKKLYLKWKREFIMRQREIFNSILKEIIRLARYCFYSDDEIKELLMHHLETKTTCLEQIHYYNSKLMRKKV